MFDCGRSTAAFEKEGTALIIIQILLPDGKLLRSRHLCTCVRACVRACVCSCTRSFASCVFCYLVILSSQLGFCSSTSHFNAFIPVFNRKKFDISVMSGSGSSSSKDRPASRTSFIPELQSMMFALGDARRPQTETAALVEDVVHTQLITMLHQACEGAVLRGSRVISAEDILFLMRKDKTKMARLLRYLQFRDYKSKLLKSLDDEDAQQDADRAAAGGGAVAGGNQRRQRLAQDFLLWMDQTGELLSLAERQDVDPVKQERMERLERQTRYMDQAQYSEFCESRQLSFAKKASKFRDWLDCSSLELKPNSVAMEMLSYLAYETVAQIVDLSLLVKQEMTMKTSPVSHVISATYIHYNTHTEVKKDPDSPEATPPSTPGSSLSAKPLLQGNGSVDGRAIQKKRKKSCPAAVEPPSGAIQPCHIREAIRRYNYRPTSAYRRGGMAFLTC